MKTYAEFCEMIRKFEYNCLALDHIFPRTAIIMYTEDNTWAVTIRHTTPRKQKEYKSFNNAAYYAYRMGAISLLQIAGANSTSREIKLNHTKLDHDAFKSLAFLN